jgi:Ala-tRNA(Pro) deacylase
MQPSHPPPATPEQLFAFLERLGIATTTVNHPALFSVEQSRALRGEIPGGHTKNLFLVDRKDRLFLVAASEDATIELKHLHRLIGASDRLSFGKADVLRAALGVEPGSVTPFAVMNDREHRVTVVLDEAMLADDVLNFHPLTNTRTTRIASADLLRFLEATGHKPQILAISIPATK